jgi:hypothetical protein
MSDDRAVPGEGELVTHCDRERRHGRHALRRRSQECLGRDHLVIPHESACVAAPQQGTWPLADASEGLTTLRRREGRRPSRRVAAADLQTV